VDRITSTSQNRTSGQLVKSHTRGLGRGDDGPNLAPVVLRLYTRLSRTLIEVIFSESDQNIVKRVIERADEIPFTEELFANVGIWGIRFVKRRRFATRLYLSLIHLSLHSMSEVFIERSQALRDCASSHFTEQWQRDYLTQLADLSPGYFFRGQSPLTSLAIWTLNTRHISNGVLYLASGLDKIYEAFRTGDTACLRRENDEAEFAKLMQLERSSTVTIGTHLAETYAARAAQLVRDARTYRSLAIWDADPNCEWRCSFVPPERCHVTQAGAGDFDEWITIGSDHYWNLGFWIGPMTAEVGPLDMRSGFALYCNTSSACDRRQQ